MKVNKSIIVGLAMLVISGLGAVLWFSFNTIIENKIKTNEVQKSLQSINSKFDLFIALHQDQNVANNKRLDNLSDSITTQGQRNIKGHEEIIRKVNNIIYIEKKTDKKFLELWNTLTLTVR